MLFLKPREETSSKASKGIKTLAAPKKEKFFKKIKGLTDSENPVRPGKKLLFGCIGVELPYRGVLRYYSMGFILKVSINLVV